MQVGIRTQLVHGMDDIREADTLVPREDAGRERVALHQNSGIQCRPQACDAQQIAVAQRLAVHPGRQIDRQHLAAVLFVEAG